jgi:hypothetical protein
MSVLEQYGLSVAGSRDKLPVVSIRGDKLNLLLDVVSAARAWAHGGPGEALRRTWSKGTTICRNGMSTERCLT